METPSVHIIILNWNGLADTLDCLASVRQLTYPNVRVKVVRSMITEVRAKGEPVKAA